MKNIDHKRQTHFFFIFLEIILLSKEDKMPFSVKSRSLANTENDVRSKNIIFCIH